MRLAQLSAPNLLSQLQVKLIFLNAEDTTGDIAFIIQTSRWWLLAYVIGIQRWIWKFKNTFLKFLQEVKGPVCLQRCSTSPHLSLFWVCLGLWYWPLAPLPRVLISAADFPHVRMFPSESPVRTSPVRLNTKHWMNLGFLYFWRVKENHVINV